MDFLNWTCFFGSAVSDLVYQLKWKWKGSTWAHLTWASMSLRSASLYSGRYLCRTRRACCLKMAVMYTVDSTAETGLLKTAYTKITPSSEVVPTWKKTVSVKKQECLYVPCTVSFLVPHHNLSVVWLSGSLKILLHWQFYTSSYLETLFPRKIKYSFFHLCYDLANFHRKLCYNKNQIKFVNTGHEDEMRQFLGGRGTTVTSLFADLTL